MKQRTGIFLIEPTAPGRHEDGSTLLRRLPLLFVVRPSRPKKANATRPGAKRDLPPAA
jgi:hypothetical protein